MDYITITVPDMNDSFSRVVLSGMAYQMRFTWLDAPKRWMWGLYTSDRQPIIEGIRVVPSFPFNLPYGHLDLPAGAFGAISELESIGREDFLNGNAQFVFMPAQQ